MKTSPSFRLQDVHVRDSDLSTFLFLPHLCIMNERRRRYHRRTSRPLAMRRGGSGARMLLDEEREMISYRIVEKGLPCERGMYGQTTKNVSLIWMVNEPEQSGCNLNS